MTSRRLFWTLPVAAVALIGVTLWEQARSRVVGERTELRVARSMRSVGPELQFELYDSRNRTVRLSRYLGRHRVDLIFLATGASMNEDPVVAAVGQSSSTTIVLVVSQDLPQVIRSQGDGQPNGSAIVLSDAGGRIGQAPGAAARAWGAMGGEGEVGRTRWYVIDRAGRVDWSGGGPLAQKSGVQLPVRDVTADMDH